MSKRTEPRPDEPATSGPSTGASVPVGPPAGVETAPGGEAHDEYEGRRIVLTPLAPGLWPVILGALCALLAPLAGFLIGSMIGTGGDPTDAIDPMFVALFAGIVIGAIGAIVAGLGALRMLRASARRSA